MSNLKDVLKTEHLHLEPREVLAAPPSVLLGVSAKAQEILGSLGVRSVFDLALSRFFAAAARLSDSGADPRDPLSRWGAVPSDIIDEAVRGEPPSSIRLASIEVLAGINPNNSPAISEALDVKTVRDMALWPPYRAARAIFDEAFQPEAAPGFDPEAPPDLLPKSGEYPTERVFYRTLVLDEVADDASRLVPLEEAGPIDVAAAAGRDFGFRRPATGAFLTFAQSWYAQGVALGQLLHSVALAPGESTRIAMVDWSRRTRGTQDETVAETEALANVTGHNRSISEVTSAVATEAQSGFSGTSGTSTSIQAGNATGGLAGGFSGGFDRTTSNAFSFSSSTGRRELAASMAQNVMDSTQQSANAARNRRATVVREVSQAESERVTTRVVTNYNHMHALSVQYYEVVQIYRVAVQLSEAERCLFVPMKLVDFRAPGVVDRFRAALAAAALTPAARRLLAQDPETVTLTASTWIPVVAGEGKGTAQGEAELATGGRGDAGPTVGWMKQGATSVEGPQVGETKPGASESGNRPGATREGRWNDGQLADIAALLGRGLRTDRPDTLRLPADVELVGLAYKSQQAVLDGARIELRVPLGVGGGRRSGFGGTTSFDLPEGPVRLAEVESITLERVLSEVEKATQGRDGWTIQPAILTVALRLRLRGTTFTLDVPLATTSTGWTKLLEIGTPFGTESVVEHLEANRLHYSQAVWQSLDAAALALLLSPYRYQGRPVMQLVDAQPLAAAGNFLVFRLHAEADDAWRTWLAEHGVDFGRVEQEIVPLPSGGVFAEAVLGRYNAAEKLDLTRFWNWQDSPIPFAAPEIAAIQTGSRAMPEDLKAGGFSQPLVAITSPTSLPDPQGMGAVLQAVQNGAMFRDMSGLAATIGLAQAGLQASSAGASAAAAQAGANFATGAQAHLEAIRQILPFVAAAMGIPMPPATGSSNISNAGATINHGAKLDRLGGGSPPSGGGSGGVPGALLTPGGGASDGGGPLWAGPEVGGIAGWPGSGSGSHQVDAFNSALGVSPLSSSGAAGTAGSGTTPTASTGTVPAAHLKENSSASTRASTEHRAFPIGEAGRPGRNGATQVAKATELGAIITWLDVETSARYQAAGQRTFCNIYAYDYCYLSGVYLPRVWWRPKAIERLLKGEQVTVEYDKTVSELNANSLLDWLEDYGPQFGWTQTSDLTELQTAANNGGVCIICAQRKELNQPGHIVAVVPETTDHKAVREGDEVTQPLQSQAGATNFRYRADAPWWNKTQFRKFGFFYHA